MLNKVILIGRTTKDVDLRKTTSGTAVATFTLAVDNRFVLKDGKSSTDFISSFLRFDLINLTFGVSFVTCELIKSR